MRSARAENRAAYRVAAAAEAGEEDMTGAADVDNGPEDDGGAAAGETGDIGWSGTETKIVFHFTDKAAYLLFKTCALSL